MCAERFVPEEKKRRPTVTAVAHSQTEMIGNQVRHLFERESRPYTLNGVQIGNFQQTLDMIKRERNPDKKAKMFLEFTHQLSEAYRLNPEKQNSFGIKYDEEASDPTKVTGSKKLNCLSGNFSFGCFVKTLAKETGVEATVVMKEVVSVSGSDYVGHVSGQVTIKGAGELFFDITNASDKPLNFQKLDKPNRYKTGGYTYVFGANYQINDMTLYAAQIQEKLVTKQTLSKSDADFLVKMDPVFLTYLIESVRLLSKENMDRIADGIGRINEPNARLRLSLHMTEYYYEKGEVDKARTYARMVVGPLNEMVSAGRIDEVKFSSYLERAAIAFNLLAGEKGGSIILYKMVVVTLAFGETSEMEDNLKKLGPDARARFFKTVWGAMEKRVANGYVYVLNRKDGIAEELVESMAIAKLLGMIEDSDFARTSSGRTIVHKLTSRMRTNCRELGLDYDSLTKVTAAFTFNTGYEDNQKTKYSLLLAKLDRIWSVVKGNATVMVRLQSLYVGNPEGFAELNRWFEKVRPLS